MKFETEHIFIEKWYPDGYPLSFEFVKDDVAEMLHQFAAGRATPVQTAKHRYFLIFYSGLHCGWAHQMTTGEFVNILAFKKGVALNLKISEDQIVITNLIELSEVDYINAIR